MVACGEMGGARGLYSTVRALIIGSSAQHPTFWLELPLLDACSYLR